MVIRRVLLDAFGTIFSPSRPIATQYAEVARLHGIAVQDEQVRVAFKRAFKQWIKEHPMYGKHSVPSLEPGDWWTGVIHDTFRLTGVPNHHLEEVIPSLSRSLIQRFWGREGYTLHSEFESFLISLRELNLPPPLIVSNTDPALIKIVENLGISAKDLGSKGIKLDEILTTWDVEKEKQETGFWNDVLDRLNRRASKSQAILHPEEVLVVGDELVADYETPRKAGFKSLLLRRLGTEEAHDNPSYMDEVDGRKNDVETVRDLTQVIRWIEEENVREGQ